MISRNAVLDLVKSRGPLLPTDITSTLKENSFVVGAFLSELVSAKEIKISNAKLGGSPLYYVETQKPGLSRLYDHLNEKNRRAYDILKSNEVLLDEPQSPLMRTALRAISDFAVPFKVTYMGKQQLFWKWYLSSDEVVTNKVKEILKEIQGVAVPEKKSEPVESASASESAKPSASAAKPISLDEEKPLDNKSAEVSVAKVVESEKPKVSEEKKFEVKEATTKVEDVLESSSQTKLHVANNEDGDDEFLKQVEGYLNSLKIKILEFHVVKKEKELDLVVNVPSSVGNLIYFCKARNKKKSNEGDIAAAYVDGLMKNLPVIYVSPGDVPKKVDELLISKYKNMKILKL